MREEQRIGPPRVDALETHPPRLEVDVRRRCRRDDGRAGPNAHAGRVSDKRDAAVRVEVEVDVAVAFGRHAHARHFPTVNLGLAQRT